MGLVLQYRALKSGKEKCKKGHILENLLIYVFAGFSHFQEHVKELKIFPYWETFFAPCIQHVLCIHLESEDLEVAKVFYATVV